MTESEWLAGTDPVPMLYYLQRKTSDRKLRLFAVGCARRIWEVLGPNDQANVEFAERFAEHSDDLYELDWFSTFEESHEAAKSTILMNAWTAASKTATNTAYAWATEAAMQGSFEQFVSRLNSEHQGQADLLRCVFGNPFHPVSFHPGWLTPTVKKLA